MRKATLVLTQDHQLDNILDTLLQSLLELSLRSLRKSCSL